MIQSVAISIVAVMTFAAAHSLSLKMIQSKPEKASISKENKEVLRAKTRQLTVPVIAGGAVKGYLLVQFSYSRAKDNDKAAETLIESIMLDEALGYLFPRSQDKSGGLEKIDVEQFRKFILERVQSRVPDKQVNELRLNEFTFMNRSELK